MRSSPLPSCSRPHHHTTTPKLVHAPHATPPQGCTSAIFFEVRKKMDLYLWLSKCPDGPSAKFLVENSE